MEAPSPDNHGAPLEPVGFGLGKPTESLTDHSYLHEFQFSLNGTSTVLDSPGSTTAVDSTVSPEEEEECLVDSQPMCFNKNPFLVANRKGKGLPPGEQILSGPPVGYGRQGKLQPWLQGDPLCKWALWPSLQIQTFTRPGAIQPVGRVRPTTSPGTPERHSPNPFQHGPSPFNSQTSVRPLTTT
ncbi:hypothetical protein XENOCAPTIV_027847 [Xenoophorus captivus]|uniref:Uncharacterized protein n=1 Tax=Xenoophorus captivus TaxID=1517983 RepID=A0ABV0RT24_9TELE